MLFISTLDYCLLVVGELKCLNDNESWAGQRVMARLNDSRWPFWGLGVKLNPTPHKNT